jgi:rod shape-determining protein MreC
MSRRTIIASSIAFLALTVLILTLSPHNMRRVQASFLGMISPFLKTGSSVERKYHEYRERLKRLEELEADNKRLLVTNKELSATNQTLRGLEAENNRLRNALGYRQRAVFKLMPAQIIARDASTWYQKVSIDRGSDDYIKVDMPVLTEEGLVGKTTVVSDNASVVVLIADETCRVAANVEGTREQGIVQGSRTSSNTMPVITLNFLTKQADLKPNQEVYTSGVGGVFPAGVLIGQVREFKIRELDAQAVIVPKVDLTTLQDVFVVVGPNK